MHHNGDIWVGAKQGVYNTNVAPGRLLLALCTRSFQRQGSKAPERHGQRRHAQQHSQAGRRQAEGQPPGALSGGQRAGGQAERKVAAGSRVHERH